MGKMIEDRSNVKGNERLREKGVVAAGEKAAAGLAVKNK